MKKIIKIYTDGSCLGNPGPGAWACLFLDVERKKIFKKIVGREMNTTNNRMEMTAILMALRAIKQAADFFSSFQIKLYSDSNLVVQTLNCGWKRKANIDLWQAIDQARTGLQIEYHWVKGHDIDEYNNQCDRMAQQEARKALKLLQKPSTSSSVVLSTDGASDKSDGANGAESEEVKENKKQVQHTSGYSKKNTAGNSAESSTESSAGKKATENIQQSLF